MKKQVLAGIFVSAALASLFFVMLAPQVKWRRAKPAGPEPLPPLEHGVSFSVVGVLRTSGLSAAERRALDTPNADYQVTDFGSVDGTDGRGILGFFLGSDSPTIAPLVGRCVRVTADIRRYWDSVPKRDFVFNDQYTFGRMATTPISVTELDRSACRPYAQYAGTPPPLGAVAVTLGGVIERMRRPAADVGYDYALRIEQSDPKLDALFAQQTGLAPERVPFFVKQSIMWGALEDAIGRSVTVRGYAFPSYAGSVAVTPVEIR